MTDVTQFYNLSHTFISLIGGILMLTIYYNITQRFSQILEDDDSQKRVDRGLLFLSMAMFVWVVLGLWAIVSHSFGFDGGFVYQVGVNILSIINNMFLLFAIFYFYHAPSFIYKNERNVKLILSIIVGVTVSTLGISYFIGDQTSGAVNYMAIPDLLLSGFLCYLLMVSMYKTFAHRGLPLVSIISVIAVALVFVSQLPEVFSYLYDDFTNNLIKIIAKTSLISIFLVLATTWVIQLANTPRLNEMQIKFIDWSLINLSIPSKNIDNTQIDFGSKTTQYKNLFKFAIRRKYGSGDGQSIIIGSAGEIKNQTYLSRVIDNINEISDLQADQKLERRDLFTFLGEGRYRLRMLPEHIHVDESLLKEFVQSPENIDYKDLL
jgi:hypothetical protein